MAGGLRAMDWYEIGPCFMVWLIKKKKKENVFIVKGLTVGPKSSI